MADFLGSDKDWTKIGPGFCLVNDLILGRGRAQPYGCSRLGKLSVTRQPRAAVQSTIRFALNELPEDSYPEPLWNDKVDAVCPRE
jgi:hypothetical protein